MDALARPAEGTLLWMFASLEKLCLGFASVAFNSKHVLVPIFPTVVSGIRGLVTRQLSYESVGIHYAVLLAGEDCMSYTELSLPWALP